MGGEGNLQASLEGIVALATEALALADNCDQFVLAAKLFDAIATAQALLEALGS
jgi:hypothetical protein